LKDITRSCGDKSFAQNHVIFLDKNHPKDQILKVISEISAQLPINVQAKFLYLIPQCDESQNVKQMPFTAQFLL